MTWITEDKGKFLDMYNIPRIKQEEVESINILITRNKTVSVKKKQKNPTNKSPGHRFKG